MAHFAELDESQTVLRVIVVSNEVAFDEPSGIAFCQSLFGDETTWVQTSYNANIRKRYAGAGMTYDANKDIFIGMQPFASWTLDEDSEWMAPVPKPKDGNAYRWDESALQWQARKLIPPAG